jgi:hypothetical protein
MHDYVNHIKRTDKSKKSSRYMWLRVLVWFLLLIIAGGAMLLHTLSENIHGRSTVPNNGLTPNKALISITQDMDMFEGLYHSHGHALSKKTVPFILSLESALNMMSRTGRKPSLEAKWKGNSFFIIGAQQRYMIMQVHQSVCETLLSQNGEPMREAGSGDEGLAHIGKYGGSTSGASCYRQRWEGGVSPLFAMLEYGAKPGFVVSHVLYKKLNPPAERPLKI